MTMPMLKVAPVRKSVRVNAPAARAFEVFTARFGTWWPKSHHIGKAPMKEAVIEPRSGGRWYEKGEDGTECDWGEVLVWEPPSRVVLSWRLNGKFEVDETLVSEVEIRFIPDGAGATRVELEHRIEAADADVIRASVDSPGGWSGILESYRQTAEA
jgi:uncharacterized protein YndB with AHSA1/START domain